MILDRAVLGDCPACDAAVPASRVLIEYETATGQTAVYADCPACRDVVHPV